MPVPALRSSWARAGALLLLGLAPAAFASSHREAPFITGSPKVDATDLYMFRSYEPGRQDTVTILANYMPFQDPQGGPNFFMFDPDALYEIHIDNNGDAKEDLSFQFRFANASKGQSLSVGGQQTKIPLINSGTLGTGVNPAALNVRESCAATGRVFVGQRKEPFFIAVGKTFDLFNLNPLGPEVGGNANDLERKIVSTIALELPIACVARSGEPVIGAWTTASLRQGRLLNGAPGSGLGKVALNGSGTTGAVPGSAAASVAAFTDFIRGLAASETAEPLEIGSGFTPPTDDTAEPLPLG